jgi:hypothetical protein
VQANLRNVDRRKQDADLKGFLQEQKKTGAFQRPASIVAIACQGEKLAAGAEISFRRSWP